MREIYITITFIFISILNCFGQKQKDEPVTYLDDLSIGWVKDSDTLLFRATSKVLVPIEIYFTSEENKQELNSFLLKPKDSLALLTYFGELPDSIFTARFADSVRVGYFLGHKSLIAPDLDYLYRLPFKSNKKYEVSQSFNDKFSHNSSRSRYAIDFQLDVGEPVFAAREGTVVKVIDWFSKQGGEELIDAANKIVIMHSDGTLASYVHLDFKGSLVKEGEWVERGQKIGISGLTGFTRGPHLHFVVRKERDISIPIAFKGYEGKMLKKGKRYQVVE
ncbi:M23 family metallopeptidase [Algoriphagus halophytocola]|uniref:M23 family metallopeptidase n=1 Tax=Algoriphagus halophytocola TaxID=2991499 RepID=A0ABY6MKA6_9BACT|nr:M23 family metallopeptidase [Algoriphagus sp. TR-M5]UZD24195.1 M23 family metallopeptidase [Algoriphagus sp. TR-M5]